MKTIGLVGGMSWESTVTYYQIINQVVREQLGGLHSAKILLYSVDFAEMEALQSSGQWDQCAELMAGAAEKLEKAGADFILLCANTSHREAPKIQARIHVPLLHIAEVAADALRARNISRIGLLGTRYTMTQDFYRDKLRQAGIEVLVPGDAGIRVVDDVIYHELCLGQVRPESRKRCLRIIGDLKHQGAQGIILGCTELDLLIRQEDSPLPLFDTTRIHAEKAALLSLED